MQSPALLPGILVVFPFTESLMAWLIAGVLLWSALHLSPALLPGTRRQLMDRLGNKRYRGLFALLIVGAIVLIVIGWRSVAIRPVYVPPLYGSSVVMLLMYVSFLLFAAADAPGNLKRFIRHPMLTGAVVWSIAHLLANGDNRSVVLFGGIGAWALVEMIAINHRDGAWQRPAPVAVSKDVMTAFGSAVLYAIVLFLHKYLFGVAPLQSL